MLIGWTVPPLARRLWNEAKDIRDRTPLDPIFSLNRRPVSNTGIGYWRRRQPDPNTGKFRKYEPPKQFFAN